MATRSVEENVKKARSAFFKMGGIGAFQGDLSPLSTKSVITTCVLPVLLYGCENWILSERNMVKLNSAVGELCKRALRWPRHFSNTAAMVVLGLDSARVSVLMRKLFFLYRLLDGRENVGSVVMSTLIDDVESVVLVQECRDLEEKFGTAFADCFLRDKGTVSMCEVKEKLRRLDREMLLEKCDVMYPVVADIERKVGWRHLWETALDLGYRHTRGLQALSRLMCHHGRGMKPCPLCDSELSTSLLDHVLAVHDNKLRVGLTSSDIVERLLTNDIKFVYCFWSLFFV